MFWAQVTGGRDDGLVLVTGMQGGVKWPQQLSPAQWIYISSPRGHSGACGGHLCINSVPDKASPICCPAEGAKIRPTI